MNIIDLTQSNGGGSGEGVVHIEGQETITGSKTFSANTYIGSVGEPADLNIVGDLNIQGDIIQNGSSYETHAEKIYTKNDYITLRDGAESGLLSGDYSGFQVEKYDGTNDGRLVIDNTGTARVGDVGDEQPLLTRDESASLTDDGLLIWDSANSKAINLSTITTDSLGNLTATSFNGTLNGNATSATKATNDGADNNIVDTYASQSFSNINNTGYNVLANSNALKTGDTLDNNTTIYNNVYNYYSSSFDVSKFTVVGNPIITADGIASNFSSNNYITIPDLDFTAISTFKLEGKFYSGTGVNTSAPARIFNFFDQSQTVNCLDIRFTANTNNKLKLHYLISSAGDITDSNEITVTNNEWHTYSIEFNGTNLIFKIDNVEKVNVPSQVEYWRRTYKVSIGTAAPVTTSGYFAGSIDLKQFSITVDGQTVFTPMSVDTDVVGCDKYINSNATISNDYIVSDFGVSKLIKPTFTYSDGVTNYKEVIKFTTSSDVTTRQAIRGITENIYKGIGLSVSNSQLSCRIGNGSSWNTTTFSGITANTSYFVEFEQTSTQSIFRLYDGNKTLIGSPQEVTHTSLLYIPIELGNSMIWGDTEYFFGSIDLKEFKIYVNGNLVYAPYLQIPYTRSTTGSKIVDVQYRQYLTHLADVKGSALYYTIDEVNKQYALPIGDIYGFISGSIGDIETILSNINGV